MKTNAALKLHSIEDMVQELHHWGYDFTEAEVLSWLRSRGYLVGEAGERQNAPSELCLELHWMTQTRSFTHGGGGRLHLELRPMFTETGWERVLPKLTRYARNRDEDNHDLRD